MKKLFIFILVNLVMVGLQAQSPKQEVWNWLSSSGGKAWDAINGLTVDTAGNSYFCGSYAGQMQLGTQTLQSVGNRDIFYASYNNEGKLRWLQNIGSTGFDNASEIIITPLHQLIIAGTVADGAKFGTKKSASDNDLLFVFQADLDGKPLWHTLFEGSGIKYITSLTADSLGNVYAAGVFTKTLRTGKFEIAANNTADLFIAKLNKAGECMWLHKLGSPHADRQILVSAGAGNQLVAAAVVAESYLNIGKRSGRLNDLLLLQYYTPEGNLLHETTVGGASSKELKALHQSTDGSVYMLGNFNGVLQTEFQQLVSKGGSDIVMLSWNTQQLELKAYAFGTDYNEFVNSFVLNKNNELVFTGTFSNTFTFAGETLQHTAGNKHTSFVAVMNRLGNELRIKPFDSNFGKGLQTDALGNIYVSGTYTNKVYFKTDTLTTRGEEDFFVAQLYNCERFKSGLADSVSQCAGNIKELVAEKGFEQYYWNNQKGTERYKAAGSGSLTFKAVSKQGCVVENQIALVELEAPEFDLGNDMELEGNEILTLEAPVKASAYQWSLGSTKPTQVLNANLFATGNHSIALTLTNAQGCNFTDSLKFSIKSRPERTDNELALFPSPNQGSFSWYLSESSETDLTVEIIDNTGRILQSRKVTDYRAFTVIHEQISVTAGAYFLAVRNAKTKKVHAFIIE